MLDPTACNPVEPTRAASGRFPSAKVEEWEEILTSAGSRSAGNKASGITACLRRLDYARDPRDEWSPLRKRQAIRGGVNGRQAPAAARNNGARRDQEGRSGETQGQTAAGNLKRRQIRARSAGGRWPRASPRCSADRAQVHDEGSAGCRALWGGYIPPSRVKAIGRPLRAILICGRLTRPGLPGRKRRSVRQPPSWVCVPPDTARALEEPGGKIPYRREKSQLENAKDGQCRMQ